MTVFCVINQQSVIDVYFSLVYLPLMFRTAALLGSYLVSHHFSLVSYAFYKPWLSRFICCFDGFRWCYPVQHFCSSLSNWVYAWLSDVVSSKLASRFPCSFLLCPVWSSLSFHFFLYSGWCLLQLDCDLRYVHKLCSSWLEFLMLVLQILSLLYCLVCVLVQLHAIWNIRLELCH